MNERNLAPTEPVITSGELSHALTLAQWVSLRADNADPSAVRIARALLYLNSKLQSEDVIVTGDKLKVTVALLRDLFERPSHESATVRFVRGMKERDGTYLLVLEAIDAAEVDV